MILTEFQSHKISSCCNTSRKQYTTSNNRTIFIKLRKCNLFCKDFDICSSIFFSLKEQKINIKTETFKKVFLQFLNELSENIKNCEKHHLWLMWLIKASSRLESLQTLISKTSIMRSMYNDFSFKDIIYATIASAFCRKSAAFMLAITWSVMKIEEDCALAQMIDLTT